MFWGTAWRAPWSRAGKDSRWAEAVSRNHSLPVVALIGKPAVVGSTESRGYNTRHAHRNRRIRKRGRHARPPLRSGRALRRLRVAPPRFTGDERTVADSRGARDFAGRGRAGERGDRPRD